MKYNYRTGVDGVAKRSYSQIIVSFVGIIGGAYLLFTALAPAFPNVTAGESAVVAKKLVQRQPAAAENRLYIPKIGVDVDIVAGVDEKSLEDGAWHRVPENGDPISGGNFVLAGHRFNLGMTPQQTRAKSPFYHIHNLQEGDDIYVDYKGVRYAYKVNALSKVEDNATYIEERTEDSTLTVYSCDLRGPEYGREVVTAKPVGTIAWLNGEPKLKVLQ